MGVLIIKVMYIGEKRWRLESSWTNTWGDLYGDYKKVREVATRRMMEQCQRIAREIGWCDPLDKSIVTISHSTGEPTGSQASM